MNSPTSPQHVSEQKARWMGHLERDSWCPPLLLKPSSYIKSIPSMRELVSWDRPLLTTRATSAATEGRASLLWLLEQTAPTKQCGSRSAATSSPVGMISKEFIRHLSESDTLRVCQMDPPSDNVYQYSKILSLAGQLEVWFLPIDDSPLVFAKPQKEQLMLQQTRDRLCNDQTIIKFTKQLDPSCGPTLTLKKRPCEDLGNCGKVEA